MFFFVSPFVKKLNFKKPRNFSKNSTKMSCEVELFANYLAGIWTNEEQATKFPTDWSHIQLGFYPLDQSLLNGYSFYTESANEFSLDEPYKSGVTLLEKKGEIIEVKSFSIKGPEDFWYGTYEPSLLANLTKDRLVNDKDGCNLEFKYDAKKKLFLGKTKSGKQCIIPREGNPTYLDSTAVLKENEYSSLDIGRNIENDEKVWGPSAGPFVFLKKKSFSISN
ncbi:cpeT-like protein (nucleomorph) [Hemiselmis andersenii]|uniref:CpeT-like protein n=1 Tax=Hemiselmis andersenii TaxID=464988 RepID=A9BKE0_HEMAN|nr:cpeT-like protein [Hemiselmis andersenii]ABW97973.1 cpeT-like protein [Hemiselmis andersenii]|mmetsp:Transcript_27023/g.65740  ORF Transcript_27023/g.65740 Transcript_27023/m.65740 type:complete len:222 (+) Transcript_27023:76-741(+)